ncbi:MAG: hypothetical protein IB616_02170 [Methanosarcinales archaeon]|nr:MAG: hypothetical protein IB616_02170 [Methanosarcinales archaeon]
MSEKLAKDWWRREEYSPFSYAEEDFEMIERVFDEEWREKQKCRDWYSRHPLFPFPVEGINYSKFIPLAELGKTLVQLKKVKGFDRLVKEIRNADEKKYRHAFLVAKLAVSYRNQGFGDDKIELEPPLPEKDGALDLRVEIDRVWVYFEVKTLTDVPERKKLRIISAIDMHISELLPRLTRHQKSFSMDIKIDELPPNKEVENALNKIKEEMSEKAKRDHPLPLIINRYGIRIELGTRKEVKFVGEEYDLFREAKRLFEKAKNQLPKKSPSVIIIRTSSRLFEEEAQKYSDEIQRALKDQFSPDDRNMIGAVIVTPYTTTSESIPPTETAYKTTSLGNLYSLEIYKKLSQRALAQLVL